MCSSDPLLGRYMYVKQTKTALFICLVPMQAPLFICGSFQSSESQGIMERPHLQLRLPLTLCTSLKAPMMPGYEADCLIYVEYVFPKH